MGKARAQCAFRCDNSTPAAQPRSRLPQLAHRRLLRMAGTTWDVVVLSSSPVEHAATSPPNVYVPRRVAMPAPSPLSLSPPTSPKRRASGASKPNLRAAPIPESAVRGFATVGKLVQSEYFAQQLNGEATRRQHARSRSRSLECIGEAAAATTKPRKRPTKNRSAESSEQTKPKPKSRARKAKAEPQNPPYDPELKLPVPTEFRFFANDDADTSIEPHSGPETSVAKLTKSGKPRKRRTKSEMPESGELELNAGSKSKGHRVAQREKVTKDGKLQREATSTVSAHFRGDTDISEAAYDGSGAGNVAGNQRREKENTSIWQMPESPQAIKQAAPKQRPPDLFAGGLDLEEAVTRKRDWTPPPEDTATQTSLTDSVGKENRRLVSDGNGNFVHLVSNFAYAQSPSAQIRAEPEVSAEEVVAVPKRRRVELVEAPNQQTHSRDSSPEKGKGPKKKPRTITDLVTEQYAPKLPDLSGHVTSDFFQTSTTMKVPLNDTTTTNLEIPVKNPPRKRATSKSNCDRATSKPRSKKALVKSAKSKPIVEKLLSPTSALLRMNRQDVLFGTSSQLALEESPTTVRQLQLALETSEKDANVSGGDHRAPKLQWPRLEKMMGVKRLWAASARDDKGGMLQQTNMMYIPEPDRTQDFPLLMDGTHEESSKTPTFIDIDDIQCASAVLNFSDSPTPSHTAPAASPIANIGSGSDQIEDIVFDDIDNFGQEPPPSNQHADSQRQFADIDDFISSPSSHTDISPLPKSRPPAIAATNMDKSPEKRRGKPSKSQSAPRGTSGSIISAPRSTMSKVKTKINAPTVPSTPPKSLHRFMDIEEILDSEEEALEAFSPTPPRIRGLQDSLSLSLVSSGPMSPKAAIKSNSNSCSNADLTRVLRVPSSHLQWMHIKDEIYKQLTAHIRSLPSSTDPKRPSWHERILMYEPIVLEDFTTYLNAMTRIRTYKKATQKQIKAWNQMLKRAGMDALTVPEDGEEVLVVEKELESYMAQSWCESMSICCIWGEGKGKGGARKGLY